MNRKKNTRYIQVKYLNSRHSYASVDGVDAVNDLMADFDPLDNVVDVGLAAPVVDQLHHHHRRYVGA